MLLTLTLTLVLLPEVPQETYSIRGSVTFEAGYISDAVVVYLEALSARPAEQVYADVFGNFVFGDVPAGTYYIRVQHEGFQEIAQRVELPAYNRDVMIFLTRKWNRSQLQDQVGLGTKFEVDIRQLNIPERGVREYQKALDDIKEGRTSIAIERLRRALSLAPNFIEAAFHLGSTLYKVGKFEGAEKTLTRAIIVAPMEPHLRLMLANVFVKEGKYGQALSEIDSYLSNNPDGPERASAEATRSQLIESIAR